MATSNSFGSRRSASHRALSRTMRMRFVSPFTMRGAFDAFARHSTTRVFQHDVDGSGFAIVQDFAADSFSSRRLRRLLKRRLRCCWCSAWVCGAASHAPARGDAQRRTHNVYRTGGTQGTLM
jgi:hypothetical protein